MSIYKWGPITDLPENWQTLITEDLASLAAIWQERRRHVEGSKALNKFIVQLQRQWAIETGIIEGLCQASAFWSSCYESFCVS